LFAEAATGGEGDGHPRGDAVPTAAAAGGAGAAGERMAGGGRNAAAALLPDQRAGAAGAGGPDERMAGDQQVAERAAEERRQQMNENLIERYVHEVGAHLPKRNRADVQLELRSSLEDALAAAGLD